MHRNQFQIKKMINDEMIKNNTKFKKRKSISPKSNIISKEFIDNKISNNENENTENNLIISRNQKKINLGFLI